MPGKAKKAVAPELGRKAAYVARNRAALLKSTQEVLGIKGQAVTIEDIAEHAEIARRTRDSIDHASCAMVRHIGNREAEMETLVRGTRSRSPPPDAPAESPPPSRRRSAPGRPCSTGQSAAAGTRARRRSALRHRRRVDNSHNPDRCLCCRYLGSHDVNRLSIA